MSGHEGRQRIENNCARQRRFASSRAHIVLHVLLGGWLASRRGIRAGDGRNEDNYPDTHAVHKPVCVSGVSEDPWRGEDPDTQNRIEPAQPG